MKNRMLGYSKLAFIACFALAAANPAHAAQGPSISSLYYTSAPVGALETIYGSNFGTSQGTSTVTFNGTPATSIQSWSSSDINVIVPAGATTGNVVVTVNGKASNGVAFTVTPPPTINALSPTSGPAGSQVTISGSNFGTDPWYVTFGGQYASVVSWSNTTIVATVPSVPSGNVVVQASNNAYSNGVPFTIWPYISGVSPAAGLAGTSVTISGLNFGNSQGNGSVTFNGTPAAVTSWSSTSITTTVPAGASSGNIVVTGNGYTSNGYSFVVGSPSTTTYHLHQEAGWLSGTDLLSTAAPDSSSTSFQSTNLNGAAAGTVTSIEAFSAQPVVPGFIPSGTTLSFSIWMNETAAVSGLYPYVAAGYLDSSGNVYNLCSVIGTTALTTTLAKFQVTCSTSNVTLGTNNRLYVKVSVYNSSAVSLKKGTVAANLYVEGTLNGNYDSQAAISEILYPFISSVSPTSGNTGTSVTITGGAFGASQGSSSVTFNGAAATPSSWSNTSIVVPVPASAASGPLVVTVAAQASNAVSFTVPPQITTVSPSAGPVGTVVSISGSGFGATQGNSSVSFNGLPALATSWSGTSITAQVPPGAETGPISVTVSGVVGNGALFTVTPLITAIAPSSGAWGSSVRIRGYNFGTVQGTVTFNGVIGIPGSWLDNSIVVPVPHGAASGPVVVTTAGGYSANQVSFTVTPSIASISPLTGSAGTTVTITGLNFGASQGSSQVLFNGIPATPTSWSNTTITVAAPAGVTTGPVTVVSGGASSNGITFQIAPSITTLSPNSGTTGTAVTITGSGFGPTRSSSIVQFAGTVASPTSWSNATIVVPVPAGATSGQLIVTVNGTPSNGMSFTVGGGSIGGVVSNSTNGTAIAGASIQALQAKKVVATATSAANGSYTISSLAAGTYDVTASASGFGTTLSQNQSVALNGTTTLNISLSTPGTISGKVTQSDGITAITGATVAVSNGGDPIGSATTDSGGNYSVGGLGAATYSATATQTGYTSQTQSSLTVTGGASTPANFSLAAQSLITYTYDAHGRLVGASDSLSNTAVYQYDAVGNLLSISRNSSSQISIIQISPTSGPAGTTVTINGTAFSSVAGQDSVSFNGTAASITSASPTQLVVTVPNGATTGTISVTAPSATATSSQTFTVTSGSSGPTITSFTPGSGVSATAVTINGTGFDTNQINDVVKFNDSPTTVSSATNTVIMTSVPTATSSGHISVRTKNGLAVSTQDFYVPFGTYTASKIGFTGRMTENSTQTVAISTAGTIGLLLFDGVAGQSVSVTATGSSFSSCNLMLIDPFGHQIASMGCTGSSNSSGGQTLSYSGTYTIGIDPQGTTGSVSVNLGAYLPFTSSLISGTSTTFTTAYPGQSAKYTFGGTTGQLANLIVSNSTIGCCYTVTILNPDGSTLLSTRTNSSSQAFGPTTLPATGTYTLLFAPDSGSSGSATLTLYLFSEQTGVITPGTPTPVTISSPGQSISWPFSGTLGQLANVTVSNSTFGCCYTISILSPDGTTLFSTRTSTSQAFGPTTLPSTGTYTLVLTPDGGSSGNATVTLYLFSGQTGSITPGTPTTVTISTPGQSVSWPFSGTASQLANVTVSNATFGCCYTVSILSPDGTTILSTRSSSSSQAFGPIALPVTGTYRLALTPDPGSSGSATVELYLFSGQTGSITTGTATPVTISTPGQSVSWTFNGTASQLANVTVSNATFGCCYTISILSPDGATLLSTRTSSSSQAFGPITLPATGTYTLVLTPDSGSSGSATLTLYLFSGQPGAITPGTPTPVTISTPGQAASWTFSGTAGQLANVIVSGSTIGCCYTINILNPDSTTLLSTRTSSSSQAFGPIALPVTGTYTLMLAPDSGSSGSATVTLYLFSGQTGSITPGTPTPVTVSTPGQSISWPFSGTAGQLANVIVSNATFGCCYTVSILNPDGTTLLSTRTGNSSQAFGPIALPVTGTYTLVLAPDSGSSGSATVTLYLFSEQTGSITFGTPTTMTISTPGQSISWPFSGTAGQLANVIVSNSTFGCCYTVTILNPDGSTLLNTRTGNSSQAFGPTTLPATGTYKLVLTPDPGSSGNGTLTLYLFNGQTGSITPGTPTTVTISTPGQSASWPFSGTAGQLANVIVSNSTIGCCYTVTILNPDGTALLSTRTGNSSQAFGPVTLPATGTYTLIFAPDSGSSGSATLTLYLFSGQTGSITSGTPTPATISTPGQSALWTFSGTAGQLANVTVSNSTFGCCYTVAILNPDTTTLLSTRTGNSSQVFGPITLPATGTYTLLLTPDSGSSGSATITLLLSSPSVISPGTNTTITVATAGQIVQDVFSGLLGQSATVQISNSSFNVPCQNVAISILNPNGSTLASGTACNGSLFQNPVTLPATGYYVLEVVPPSNGTGTVTVNMTLSQGPGTITPGTPTPVTVSTPGQVVSWNFSGTAGQLANVTVSNSTIGCCYTISILSQDGTTLLSTRTGNSSQAFGPVTLPTTGTYTLVLTPDSGSSGSATLTLYLFSGQTGSITPGTATPVTISTPGQSASWPFSGTAGQLANVTVLNSTFGCCYTITILSPDGATLLSTRTSSSSQAFGPITLPVTGAYRLVLTPDPGSSGTATVTLYLFSGQTGSITPGTATPVTISTPGQSASWPFSGTAGQLANVTVSNSTFGCCYTITILSPDGATLLSTRTSSSSQAFGPITLPVTGAYMLVLTPDAGSSGSATVTLYLFSGQTGSITPGTATPVTISTPGQSVSWSFSGTASQLANVIVSNSTFGCCYTMTILSPDGATLLTTRTSSSSQAFGPIVLPVTGTYRLILTPDAGSSGSATVTLYLFSGQTGSITPGTPTPVTVSTPGQSVSWPFSGTAGQLANVTVSNSTFGCCYTISFLSPDGETLLSVRTSSSSQAFGPIKLPATGMYTLLLTPDPGSSGTATLTLFLFSGQPGAIPPGTPTPVTISTPGQSASWTFSGTTGQLANVIVSNSTFGCCFTISILNPDSTTLLTTRTSASSQAFGPVPLPATGTYTLVLTPDPGSSGSATVTLYLFSGQTGSITPGAPTPVTISTPGQSTSWTFSGTTGQLANVIVSNSTFGCCFTISILNPDSTTLLTTRTSASSQAFGPVPLPATGTYTLVLTPDPGSSGNATVTLYLFSGQTGSITPGTPTPVTINTPGQSASWPFSGTAGQLANVTVSNSTFGCCYTISILNPDTTTLLSTRTSNTPQAFGPVTLPATGTYTLVLTPDGGSSGSATVTLIVQ